MIRESARSWVTYSSTRCEVANAVSYIRLVPAVITASEHLSQSHSHFHSLSHCFVLKRICLTDPDHLPAQQTGVIDSATVLKLLWLCLFVAVFTALHVMQPRYGEEISVCLSVCPSVRLSVRHTCGLWQNGRKIGPDFYTIRKNIYPSFLRRRMVDGGRPLLGEILGQPTPIGTKSPIFNQ